MDVLLSQVLKFTYVTQALRETCGKQLEAKNQELVDRDEQIAQLTNQVKSTFSSLTVTCDSISMLLYHQATLIL